MQNCEICLPFNFVVSVVIHLKHHFSFVLSVVSSGIIWEQMKGKRYKALKTNISRVLEDGFSSYSLEALANKAKPGNRALKGNVEVLTLLYNGLIVCKF